MNSNRQRLTDEDLAEMLARPASVGEDGSEAIAMRAAFSSYRTEALVWAERRSSTQPSLQPAARRSRFWAAVPQWSLAAVAVISIAAGVARVYDRPDAGDQTLATTQTTVTAVSVARTSDADIAADNRLLSSIDQALSYHVVPPVSSIESKPSRSTRASSSTGVMD